MGDNEPWFMSDVVSDLLLVCDIFFYFVYIFSGYGICFYFNIFYYNFLYVLLFFRIFWYVLICFFIFWYVFIFFHMLAPGPWRAFWWRALNSQMINTETLTAGSTAADAGFGLARALLESSRKNLGETLEKCRDLTHVERKKLYENVLIHNDTTFSLTPLMLCNCCSTRETLRDCQALLQRAGRALCPRLPALLSTFQSEKALRRFDSFWYSISVWCRKSGIVARCQDRQKVLKTNKYSEDQ